jgi:hypothetical protein
MEGQLNVKLACAPVGIRIHAEIEGHTSRHDRIEHGRMFVEQVLVHDLLPVVAKADQFILIEVNKSPIKSIRMNFVISEDF